MTKPSLLVVLPSLGQRLEYLERALKTCVGLANFADVSVCAVIPDTSPQAKAQALSYGATVLSDPGRGMSAAINAALAWSEDVRYYTWLGDDDELVPEGVYGLIGALEDDKDAVLAHGYCEYIDENGRILGTNRAGTWASRLVSWGPNLIPHPGTVIRVDALDRIGGFDESLRFVMDLDVFLRLRSVGRTTHRKVVASRFRWHADSTTVAARRASSREARMVKVRYLPVTLRAISALWNYPVEWASWCAAALITMRARTNRRALH